MTRWLLAVLACAGAATAQDHSHHVQQQLPASSPPVLPSTPAPAEDPHARHRVPPVEGAPYTPPALTDADRAAAFPELDGHDMGAHMDDDPFVWMLLVDRIEWQRADAGHALAWESHAWLGHDEGRLWLRSEGTRAPGGVTHARSEALWGQPLTPWWDLLAGIRHDSGAGPSRQWAAVGVQGMAPYKLEVEVTAYVGAAGRTALHASIEYDVLISNRLILQPGIEASAYGRADPARGLGAGLAEAEAGLRLRYEIRRELAPYIGIAWSRRFGASADFARDAGEPAHDARLVAGLRVWF